jgi:hypothetical protein
LNPWTDIVRKLGHPCGAGFDRPRGARRPEMMVWKLLGLLLALGGAKLWLAGTVPWFVGAPLLVAGCWLFFRPQLPTGGEPENASGGDD